MGFWTDKVTEKCGICPQISLHRMTNVEQNVFVHGRCFIRKNNKWFSHKLQYVSVGLWEDEICWLVLFHIDSSKNVQFDRWYFLELYIFSDFQVTFRTCRHCKIGIRHMKIMPEGYSSKSFMSCYPRWKSYKYSSLMISTDIFCKLYSEYWSCWRFWEYCLLHFVKKLKDCAD